MSIAFDAKPTAYNSADGLNQEVVNSTAISATSGMTVGGSANLLIAMLTFGSSGTPPSNLAMTWNGVNMSSEVAVNSGAGPSATAALFSLANPAPGAKTLSASWTTARDCYMSCVSFSGAAVQSSTSNTQSTSINVVTQSDGATVANFGVDGATPTVSQTKIWAEAPNTPGGGGSYALGGSGTNNHAFTGAGGTQQVIVALTLKATGITPSSGAYQQEQNTTDRYLLEDGSGVYLIEPWGQTGGFIPPRMWGDLDGLARYGFKDRLNG